ncbi:MAG: hypothetical protein ABH950_07525 [Candidatus Altiarchaeota archaeon]
MNNAIVGSTTRLVCIANAKKQAPITLLIQPFFTTNRYIPMKERYVARNEKYEFSPLK